MTREQQNVRVVLYTRQNCGLCRDAENILRTTARHCAVSIVDIDTDDALLKQYALRIPVVTVNGDEVAEGHIDPDLLIKVIRAASRAAKRSRVSRWRFWA